MKLENGNLKFEIKLKL